MPVDSRSRGKLLPDVAEWHFAEAAHGHHRFRASRLAHSEESRSFLPPVMPSHRRLPMRVYPHHRREVPSRQRPEVLNTYTGKPVFFTADRERRHSCRRGGRDVIGWKTSAIVTSAAHRRQDKRRMTGRGGRSSTACRQSSLARTGRSARIHRDMPSTEDSPFDQHEVAVTGRRTSPFAPSRPLHASMVFVVGESEVVTDPADWDGRHLRRVSKSICRRGCRRSAAGKGRCRGDQKAAAVRAGMQARRS